MFNNLPNVLCVFKTDPPVLIKPNIILPERKVVPEGYSTLSIPCYAEGIPVPTITWKSLGVSMGLLMAWTEFTDIESNDDISWLSTADSLKDESSTSQRYLKNNLVR